MTLELQIETMLDVLSESKRYMKKSEENNIFNYSVRPGGSEACMQDNRSELKKKKIWSLNLKMTETWRKIILNHFFCLPMYLSGFQYLR